MTPTEVLAALLADLDGLPAAAPLTAGDVRARIRHHVGAPGHAVATAAAAAVGDLRLTDAATGLPPLEEVEPADTVLLLGWYASEGLVVSPVTAEPAAVRYLSVRGLAMLDPDLVGAGRAPNDPQWVQVHIAVPVEAALDVAAALAKGTTEQLG